MNQLAKSSILLAWQMQVEIGTLQAKRPSTLNASRQFLLDLTHNRHPFFCLRSHQFGYLHKIVILWQKVSWHYYIFNHKEFICITYLSLLILQLPNICLPFAIINETCKQ